MNDKKHLYSYLNSAVHILSQYHGEIPFASFLKKYFSTNKKFGSKDRRQISRLCYAYFRLGKSLPNLPVEKKILLGLSLSDASKALEKEWFTIIDENEIGSISAPQHIFPWKDELSETIDSAAFEASFLMQPDLFLRIRPGFEKIVPQKLQAANIGFIIEEDCVRLNNTTKVDSILQINTECVVQDLSSQKNSEMLNLYKSKISNHKSQISIWDCCAASGGKSILAKDVLGNVLLTVTDIRPSIIANLKKRFAEANIKNYNSFVTDVTKSSFVPQQQYDLVIADVPCTGSGTWARTPEQLFYFNKEKVNSYAALQSRILTNITDAVKVGGHLLYITCSVFRQENEDHIAVLTDIGFSVVSQKIITGYDKKADTMFAALFVKER